MLHSLEDFCRFIYPAAEENELRRRYYQLVRFTCEGYKKNCYHPLRIVSAHGKERVVHAPCAALKKAQRAVACLLADAPCSEHATAYRHGSTLTQNALPHLQQKLLFKADLSDFFGSISFAQVFWAVDRALRTSDQVGPHHLNAFDRAERKDAPYNSVLSFYFARLCTLDGALVQGSPASPVLSNLVFYPLDRAVASYCEKRTIRYTRYSDDMTFSGDFNHYALLSFLARLLGGHGFALHPQKTSLCAQGYRQKVTGAVVNDKLQADAQYRRQIRQELHFVKKFGVEDHLARLYPDGADPAHYLSGLLGRIGFVLQLNPADAAFAAYRSECATLLHGLAGERAAL